MSARRPASARRPSREVEIDLTSAVEQFRKAARNLRRLDESRPTRNVGATDRAIARHSSARDAVLLALALAGHIALMGELTEEDKLVDRLTDARRVGQDRPELRARLSATRRSIKALVQL